MAEIFWGKFKQFDTAAKWAQFKVWLKTRRTILTHRFTVRKDAAKKSVVDLWKKSRSGFLGLLFDHHYGVRLVNSRTAVLSYLAFFALSLTGIVLVDGLDQSVNFLHPVDANEAVIGATTILLALFIPLAIALIEDARVSPLARLTVVKSVIRFRATLFALLLICVFFFVPLGWEPLSNDLTARELYSAVVVSAILFILMSFLRAYRWLSDPSINSSGDPETLSPDDPQPEAFPSYRFAHIVRLLSGAKSYETWCIVWSQRFPPEYENALHTAFLKRQRAVVKGKKAKKYIILSVEMEAYNKYFDKRNKDTWWFYLDYLKQFLLLYAEVVKLIEADRTVARTMGLGRGKAALQSINQKLISNSLDPDRVWHLFEAMDEYVAAANLLMVGDKSRIHDSALLNYFIDEYFESQFNDRLDGYYAESYLKERSHWLITYDNLYKERYNVTFVVAERFKEWLFNKLYESRKGKNGLYQVDSIIKDLFPEADPITISDLYWLLYQAKNTTDSELIIKNHYSEVRPFGVIGRASMTDWVDDEEVRMKNFAEVQHEQEENAIKLFAQMHWRYFLQFWNLDELIDISHATLEKGGLKEKEEMRLQSLLRRLEAIKSFYESERKNQAAPKSRKASDERRR